MKIVISEFMSLDGVVQAPGGPDEDTDGGFAHGGWSMPFFDPEAMGPVVDKTLAETDTLLFGRRTWQTMAAAWPERAGDPFADRMNALPKLVVSGTLTPDDLVWTNSEIVDPAKLVETVGDLRARDGGAVQVMGSSQLVRSLLAAGLVDELVLMVEPVVLGGGKGIFPADGQRHTLELVESTPTSTGVLICRYRTTSAD